MSSDQQIWQIWAYNLHRWGLAGWVAAILEAAGPFTILAAQLVHLAQPLANKTMPNGHIQALAEMLEEPTQAHRFANLLREDDLR